MIMWVGRGVVGGGVVAYGNVAQGEMSVLLRVKVKKSQALT